MNGFDSFKVVGNVTPKIAEDTATEVKHEPIQDPEELLAYLKFEKLRGEELRRDGHYILATKTWLKACRELVRIVRGRHWLRTRKMGGTDFDHEVIEVFYQLHSNRCAHFLRRLREVSAAGDPVPAESRRWVFSILYAARAVPRMLEMADEYELDATQIAEIYFRLAVTHRLTNGSMTAALRAIQVALENQPDDPEIQEEAVLVREEERRRRHREALRHLLTD